MPKTIDQTIIDGTTESTFLKGQAAVIQINGGFNGTTGVAALDGLVLAPGSLGSTVKGLEIVNFGGAGIRVESSGDTIVDNLIGTDDNPADTALGNQAGIFIDGASGGGDATIGGTSAATDSNIIGFNSSAGISSAVRRLVT